MIPSIETIVEDLAAGRITKSQAVTWLYAHSEGATNELRDAFAMAVIAGVLAQSHKAYEVSTKLATGAYDIADAMIIARKRGSK